MLVEVNASGGKTYINIDLNEVKRVTVAVQRHKWSELEMKDGTKHIISSSEEAQRVVDAMRAEDDRKE